MIFKLDPIVTVLVMIVLCSGSFFGGIHYEKATSPKVEYNWTYDYNYQYQNVKQEQMMISETSSGSLALNINNPKSNILIEIPSNKLAKTNYKYTYKSSTNLIKQSNHRIVSNK